MVTVHSAAASNAVILLKGCAIEGYSDNAGRSVSSQLTIPTIYQKRLFRSE
jgi:hypothetical protein